VSAKVAVLMCVHNGERFIREAIESVLGQTYKDFEFIIVENGSTDATWHIVQSYADSRIRSFRTPLKQLTFNLNFGLLQTQADYIARMDADDIAKPQRLSQQIAYMDAHPEVSVLGSAFEVLSTETGITNTVVPPGTDVAIRRRLPFRFVICHPTVMFRRQVVLAHAGYRDSIFCEDIDLWLRLSRDRTIRFANLEEPLLTYRLHAGQIRGRREGYVAVSSILLRESLVQRSPRLFAAFLFSLVKLARC
jgi:glycosyltransferase involved in cell wall biosynthesis